MYILVEEPKQLMDVSIKVFSSRQNNRTKRYASCKGKIV